MHRRNDEEVIRGDDVRPEPPDLSPRDSHHRLANLRRRDLADDLIVTCDLRHPET